jgi:hypothetical protein
VLDLSSDARPSDRALMPATDVRRLVTFSEQLTGVTAEWANDQFAEIGVPGATLAVSSKQLTDAFTAGSVRPAANGTAMLELLSFGTVFTEVSVLQPIVNALTGLDIDLVVTLGLTAKPEQFDVDPARVQFTPFMPLAQLLDGVSAVVSHGGAGTADPMTLTVREGCR